MESLHYLNNFQRAAELVDKADLNKKQLELETGIWLDSVVLKLQKKTWANRPPTTPQSRIFFSIWLHDETIKQNKIYYNIHAFKLRHLKGYSIASREFAENFRAEFKRYEHQWPNVSVNHGPLTLMEGWGKLNPGSLEQDILKLINRFLEIDFLIDSTLDKYKISGL